MDRFLSSKKTLRRQPKLLSLLTGLRNIQTLTADAMNENGENDLFFEGMVNRVFCYRPKSKRKKKRKAKANAKQKK